MEWLIGLGICAVAVICTQFTGPGPDPSRATYSSRSREDFTREYSSNTKPK